MKNLGIGNIVECNDVHPNRITNPPRIQECIDKKIKLEVFKFDDCPIGQMVCCNCIDTEDDIYKLWFYESELKFIAKDENEYRYIIENQLMDYFEMMQVIESGVKLKHIASDEGTFIYYNKENSCIMDDEEEIVTIGGNLKAKVWKIYKEKEKLPKYLEWVKDIPYNDLTKEIHCTREDLDGMQCSECPFGIDDSCEEKMCFKIEERIARLKKRYEF